MKALVIACNTATAHACEVIDQALEIPVIGVVEPGARAAVHRSRGGTIGVIGTQGTIESCTYERAIHAEDPDATVHSVACPLFVALAEEGWVEGEVARLTAERYGYDFMATPVFEFTEVFKRTLGDTSDIVTKEMYTFETKGGDQLTLRPENTA